MSKIQAVFRRADYYAFERLAFAPSELSQAGPWDVFWSSYDETQRVREPFDQVRADHKQWLVHTEYGFRTEDLPGNAILLSDSFDPPDLLEFVRSRQTTLVGKSICVDCTGFVRPHLLVLLRALRDSGVKKIDVLYSDPVRYREDEDTAFVIGPVERVEQIPGYEGIHRGAGIDNEVLIVGAGYDYEQIARACEAKPSSKKYLLTGLPSLQPHMYQESVLRIHEAHESIGHIPREQRLYAAANHPFAVAQVLHDVVLGEAREAAAQGRPTQNIYLCPLGPKPHVLGFALYYLRELGGKAASIIYPFASRYERLTAQGLLRTWQYRVEL
ncbi:MAG: hypothetical protein OXC94_08185 [Chloroflexi bacterium]|nr:hypothetical protein [Chloroflexota bacterium]